MQKFYRLFVGGDFFKHSLVLIGGTGFSILLQVLASPILTRLYSPADFGIFAIFFSIATFFSVIINAKYEQTILLPGSDNDSFLLVFIAIIISTACSCLIMFAVVVILTFKMFVANQWLYLLPITCFFIGIFQSGYYWIIRNKKFRLLSALRVIQALIIIIFSIVLFFVVPGFWGMILGYVVGQVVVGLIILCLLFRDARKYLKDISVTKGIKLIKRYKNFPLYSGLSGLTENLSAQLPVFLSTIIDKATVGYYSLAQRVTRVPISVISTAIGDVFRQRASFEYVGRGNCRVIFMRVFWLLLSVSIVPAVIFFMFAPELFSWIFGVKWMVAGEYARIFTVRFLLQFIVNPLGNMFIVAEKQKIDFGMQIYLLIANVLSFWCGYYLLHSVKIYFILLTAFYSFKYFFELIMSYKFSLGMRTN